MGGVDATPGPDSVYDDGAATLYCGDCREVMAALPADSVDSVITDPPYHLTTGKKGGSGEASVNLDSPYGRARVTTGFMGQQWDGGGVAFEVETWREALRVAKPGALLLAFGGTRTYHRLACAIEDAGWEVRDCLMWLYGQGFPKSYNLKDDFAGWGTALKPAWEPIMLAMKPLDGTYAENAAKHGVAGLNIDGGRVGSGEGGGRDGEETAEKRYTEKGATNYALKPGPRGGDARGRWPSNLLLGHHPDCRLEGVKRVRGSVNHHRSQTSIGGRGIYQGGEARIGHDYVDADGTETVEAWDCHPDCAVGILDAQSGEGGSGSGEIKVSAGRKSGEGTWTQGSGMQKAGAENMGVRDFGDRGGASRFFYTSKATGKDRGNVTLPALPLFGVEAEEFRNTHPTVKPTDLMEYLCRITATPTGGIVLDPFAGSGTTLVAAGRVGRRSIGIEFVPEYCEIAQRRLDDERRTR